MNPGLRQGFADGDCVRRRARFHDAGRELRCVVTSVDRDGRLADRSVVTCMGWSEGQAMEFVVEPGLLVAARASGSGSVRINRRGYVRVPLAIRHTCRIAAGDRVLVAAGPRCAELLVIPMAAFDEMLAVYRSPHEWTGR